MKIRVIPNARALMLSGALLAACEQARAEDDCGASDYQRLVGQPLAAVTLPTDVETRIIGPDTAVTTDHRPNRLNIEVDRSGSIERVYCG